MTRLLSPAITSLFIVTVFLKVIRPCDGGGRKVRPAQSHATSHNGEDDVQPRGDDVQRAVPPSGAEPLEGFTSIKELLHKIDPARTGFLDKAKVKAFQEEYCDQRDTAQNRLVDQLLERVQTLERITHTEFEEFVRLQQRSELERFFLSLDVHKILAEITTQQYGASVDALGVLRLMSHRKGLPKLIEGAKERIVGQIDESLEMWTDTARDELKRTQVESCLRQTARLALGVVDKPKDGACVVDTRLQGLQQEYSKQLKSRQSELSQTSEKTTLRDVIAGMEAPPNASDQVRKEHVHRSYAVGGLTGLMDADQFLKLKKDLWEAAGGASEQQGRKRVPEPTCKGKLVPEDYSTWTWANLGEIQDGDIAELARLQQYAGKNYVRQVKQPISLLKLTEECINMLPLSAYVQAQVSPSVCRDSSGHNARDCAVSQ